MNRDAGIECLAAWGTEYLQGFQSPWRTTRHWSFGSMWTASITGAHPNVWSGLRGVWGLSTGTEPQRCTSSMPLGTSHFTFIMLPTTVAAGHVWVHNLRKTNWETFRNYGERQVPWFWLLERKHLHTIAEDSRTFSMPSLRRFCVLKSLAQSKGHHLQTETGVFRYYLKDARNWAT